MNTTPQRHHYFDVKTSFFSLEWEECPISSDFKRLNTFLASFALGIKTKR